MRDDNAMSMQFGPNSHTMDLAGVNMTCIVSHVIRACSVGLADMGCGRLAFPDATWKQVFAVPDAHLPAHSAGRQDEGRGGRSCRVEQPGRLLHRGGHPEALRQSRCVPGAWAWLAILQFSQNPSVICAVATSR